MKYLLTCIGLCCIGMMQAQTIERQVLSSNGGYATSGDLSLEWTMGEIAVKSYTNGNLVLTEGFEQAVDISIGLEETELIVFMDVYPNPSADIIHLNWKTEEQGVMSFELFDDKGSLMMKEFSSSSDTTRDLDLSNLAAGNYHLQILIDGKIQNHTYQLLKIH